MKQFADQPGEYDFLTTHRLRCSVENRVHRDYHAATSLGCEERAKLLRSVKPDYIV